MERLLYVIAFTHDIEAMKRFYRDTVGLEPAADSPAFVSFDTGGASLALVAVPSQQKREFELCFRSRDVDADALALQRRGVKFIDEARALEFGRVIHARDPEGNLFSLLDPANEPPPGNGPTLTTAVLNCRDMVAAKAYYRDRLALDVLIDSPWWVEFDAGETHLALHPFVDQGVLEAHHAQSLTVGFSSGDLDEWVEELSLRGASFPQGIADRGFGRFAETQDPDGNTLVLRDSATPTTLEEKLAEDYESDETPHQVAIRRPVIKISKAAGRLAPQVEHELAEVKGGAAKLDGAARDSASAARARVELAKAATGSAQAARKTMPRPHLARKIPSVRGAGPERTRREPRQKRDPERVKLRPAAGHLKAATLRTMETKKRAVATASVRKPVKGKATSVRKPVKRAAASKPLKRAVARATTRAGASRPARRTARGGKR
jgi:predicted enzyme related to lactoylglutathione lyase